MPLDARIPLQAIGIQAPDVLGAMAQGQQYRQNQMAMQAAQTAAQRNAMLLGLQERTDFNDRNSVANYMRIAGAEGAPVVAAMTGANTMFNNQAAEGRAQGEYTRKIRGEDQGFMQRALAAVYNDPSDASIAAARAGAIAAGIGEADFDAYAARFMATPDLAARRALLANELGTTEQGRALLNTFTREIAMDDVGGSLVPRDTNLLAPGAVMPAARTKTPDPTDFEDISTPEGITRVYADGRSELLRNPAGDPLMPAPTREERQDAAAAAAAVAAAPQRLESAKNLTRLIDDAAANTNVFTAGFGSLSSVIPGTPAADLAGTMESIKSNLAFDRLQQMRDESRTGGALGQIVLRELDMLASVWASTQQSQSPAQLRENLAILRTRSEALVAAYQAMVDAGAGGGGGGNTPSPSGPARVQNDADFARLPSGATFIGPDGVTRRKP